MTVQALQQLIPQTFKSTFVEQIYESLVFGDIANTEFSSSVKEYGDEVDVFIEPSITYNSWTGGDLNTREKLQAATTKIKINHGGQVHFYIPRTDTKQAAKNPEMAKKYTKKTNHSFANDIDEKLSVLYDQAGITIDSSGSPIDISSTNAWKVLVECQRQLKENLGCDSLAMKDLFFIAPPAYYAHLLVDNKPFYTEEARLEAYKNGKVGKKIAGFDLYESNNCFNSGGTHYCYFGVKKQALAVAVQKDIELISYIPDSSVDLTFKGAGLFGVGLYDARKFGVVKCTFANILS